MLGQHLLNATGEAQDHRRGHDERLRATSQNQQVFSCDHGVKRRPTKPMHPRKFKAIKGIGRQGKQLRQSLDATKPGQMGKRLQAFRPAPVALGCLNIEHNAAAQGAPSRCIAQDEAIPAENGDWAIRHDLHKRFRARLDLLH